MVADADVDLASQCYVDAIDTYQEDGKERMAANIYRPLIALYINGKRLGAALEWQRRFSGLQKKLRSEHNVWKSFVSELVLCLAQEDVVGAEQSLERMLMEDGFLRTREYEAAQDLVDAFQHQSEDDLRRVLQMQLFTFLDPAVSRLALHLQLPSDGATVVRPASSVPAADDSLAQLLKSAGASRSRPGGPVLPSGGPRRIDITEPVVVESKSGPPPRDTFLDDAPDLAPAAGAGDGAPRPPTIAEAFGGIDPTMQNVADAGSDTPYVYDAEAAAAAAGSGAGGDGDDDDGLL